MIPLESENVSSINKCECSYDYSKKVKVYIYCDPRRSKVLKFSAGKLSIQLLYEPFYVGCASYHNYLRHMYGNSSNKLVNKRVRNIKKIKLKPIIRVVKRFDRRSVAAILEEKLIVAIGRKDLGSGPLLNASDGPGAKNASKADRKNRSIRMTNLMKGIGKGNDHPMYGKQQSEKTKKKISRSQKKRWSNPNNRKKYLKTRPRGENSHRTKLTEDDVLEIRKLRKEGFTIKTIASKFDVGEKCVSHIVNRNSWRHI